MLRKVTSQAVLSLALLLLVNLANAGSIAVSPLRVSLTTAEPTGAITVRNNSPEATVVQLEVVQWSQHEGADVLQATDDLLASPPIFTVPAGGQQVLRLGLRRPVDPERELTYRLILRELPAAPEEGFQGLQMVMNISLPVFVLPLAKVQPDLAWKAVLDNTGMTRLSVTNSGNAHVKVTDLSLVLADGARSGIKNGSGYVLANQSREWSVDAYAPAGSILNLVAQTDAGELHAEVKLLEP